MKELVVINEKEIKEIKYGDERVISSKQIAELHSKEVRAVNQAYTMNIDKFVEGVDYRVVNRNENIIDEAILSHLFPKGSPIKEAKLFTMSGYLKLVNIFNDNTSKHIMDYLIIDYLKSININTFFETIRNMDVDIPIHDLYVYIAREQESGRFKVGISKDPESRVKNLNTGNPEELEIIYCEKAELSKFQSEKNIHKQLTEEGKHIRGEWFSNVSSILN